MELHGPLPDIDVPDVSLYGLIFEGLTDADAGRLAALDHVTGTSLTMGQVKHDADALATWLAGHGVAPGDAVAIDLPNQPEYLSAFHGILRAGAAVTPINAAYTAPEIARQLQVTGAQKVITSPALLPQVADACARAGLAAEDVLVVGGDAAGHVSYADALATPPAPPQLAIDPATHVACLPFSSGTSGMPKAVRLSHRNLVANMLQFNEVLRPLGDDVSWIAFLPFSHIYALTTNLNYGLFRRFPQYTMAAFDPALFLQIVSVRRPRVLFLVPPVANFLAKHPAVAQADFSSVALAVSGAAPLDGAVGEALASRLGVRVIQGYGMTELSPVTHVIPLDWTDVSLDTIGPAVPNVRFRVVDPETGRDVDVPTEGESAPGELWCTGPNAMLGYLGEPADTDAVLDADGWVHTGDLVVVDARGVVRIVDRIKELIKRRGMQIAPAELEAILQAHPAVADAAVLGVRTRSGEEVPFGLVQLAPGATVEASELRRLVADQVSPHKRLGGLAFVEQVPRSAAGKILRRALPALVPERAATVIAPEDAPAG
ncbi:AMP-binding protein [Nigerium massiliense]|uniref:AMP-binding protein n=1 Tax=Nigerium massiliense TaxID=1522317 RepID=UPI0005917595|nr:AMP-binding protein [Nigerium massiliense]